MTGADASQESMNPDRWREAMPAEGTPASAEAWLRHIRAKLDGPGLVQGSGAWRMLTVGTRAYLLAMCTDRADPHGDAAAAWGSFSDEERQRIGAQARQLQRELKGAGWLR